MSQRFVLEATQPTERVDKVLTRLLPDTSRATVQRWITEGRVLLDGKPCRAKDNVRAGSTIDVDPGPLPLSDAAPDASVEFGVVHEDAHLIVVDKPAGLVVHPARGHATGTLVNGLLARGSLRAEEDTADPDARVRPGVVHRIDKGTSGLLVVAKDPVTREGLKTQLAAHSVERQYLAVTVGVPPAGTIVTKYGRDPRSRLRFTSKLVEGRRAVTHVGIVERFGGSRAALIECRLETGRTHQIRVHLSEQCQAPLLGDPLYGRRTSDEIIEDAAAALGRQALHAAVLGFVHPVTGARLRFESPLPADLQRTIARLRALG